MPMAEDFPLDGTGHRARVRERLFEGGPRALHDHEIVEYLLGLSIRRQDTNRARSGLATISAASAAARGPIRRRSRAWAR